ncbi:MAG: transcriptional regulator NrdR [Bdellovibrionales bacterium]|nr:transcriptional regulator NrdR [Bdellovibrionales bacterium]
MKCPSCNSLNTKVIETRATKDNTSIKRRRECEACSFRFSTAENLILSLPMVIKKSGSREVFNASKITNGLRAACFKRPVTAPQIQQIVDKTVRWVSKRQVDDLSSREIGIYVMNELKAIDKVASIRFASVHQSFNDIEEFVSNLEKNF